jgi:DNA-directed RNA polymerase specialized sigma24 family protein
MRSEDLINFTDKWLKSVPETRKRIKLIDTALKEDSYDMSTADKIQQERNKLHSRLSSIIKAVGTLREEDQRIICYRYFENLPYKTIAVWTGCSIGTVPRRINKSLLHVGRVMFGFEDEFWNEIYCN